MILLDTSVWIEFFKQKPEYVKEIAPMLENRLIFALEPVFAELLYGVRSQKDKEKVRAYWNFLPKIQLNNEAMVEAAIFANESNFHNLGIGLMDAVIVKAAIDNDAQIWTLDKKIMNNVDQKLIFK